MRKFIARGIIYLFVGTFLAWWLYGNLVFFTTGMFSSPPNFFSVAAVFDLFIITWLLVIGVVRLIIEADF